jgi:hypothetical protein
LTRQASRKTSGNGYKEASMPKDEASQDAESAPSSDDLALLKDLNRYDNPQVFGNAHHPQLYRFQIPKPPAAPVISVEVNGYELPNSLRQKFIVLALSYPPAKDLLKDSKGWEEIQATLNSNEGFLELEWRMQQFFIRHLPRLAKQMDNILEFMSILSVVAQLYDDPKKRNEILKKPLRLLQLLERDMKQMLRTRGRGGSRGRLAAEERQSFHTRYDEIHKTAKVIKKHYKKMFLEFEESHRRTGYTHKQWQAFWVKRAGERYASEKELVLLFAKPGGPSASEVAYSWMAQQTGYTTKYIKRLVMASRALAHKKVTIKTNN